MNGGASDERHKQGRSSISALSRPERSNLDGGAARATTSIGPSTPSGQKNRYEASDLGLDESLRAAAFWRFGIFA
jgi:hypothetical protein